MPRTRINGGILGTQLIPSQQNAPGMWIINDIDNNVRNQYWPSDALSDPLFNKVTLLIRGDGTPAANVSSTVDSSPNAFAVTTVGRPLQGTFSAYSPHGWSISCNSTSDYVSNAINSTTPAIGTGPFTMECFVYYNFEPTTGGVLLGSNTQQNGVDIYYDGTQVIGRYAAATPVNILNSGYKLSNTTMNNWHHIVMARGGSNVAMWIDGTRVASNTGQTTNYNPAASSPYFRALAGGTQGAFYLSNIRITNNDVYGVGNTTITVPTTSFTRTANTLYLMGNKNNFLISNAVTDKIYTSLTGTPYVVPFSPFIKNIAYSANVHGGSVQIPQDARYYTVTNSSSFAFGTGDFTVEYWHYPHAYSQTPTVFDFRGTGSIDGLADAINSTGQPSIYKNSLGGSLLTGFANNALHLNSWNHVAYVRSSNVLSIYVNGKFSGSNTDTTNWVAPTLNAFIGKNNGTAYTNGFTQDLRVVKGTAIYTAEFDTPTSPLTAVANTVLLLNFANAAIKDYSGRNNVVEDTDNQGGQTSNRAAKFGNTSIAFNAGNSTTIAPPYQTRLSVRKNQGVMRFGLGDFTLEFWMLYFYPNANAGVWDPRSTIANGVVPHFYLNTGRLYYWVAGLDRITTYNSLIEGKWYHIALCRYNNNTRLYINGAQAGATYADTNNYLDEMIGFGHAPAATPGFDGFMDEMRITHYARYTDKFFTIPSARFPNKT
jgi:hypothetical protein